MKIGFFTDAYFPQVNGVVTSVRQAVQELRRRGHDVYIITSRYSNYRDDKKDSVIRLSSVLVNKKLNIRLATHFPEKELFDLYKMDFSIIHGHGGGTISLLGLEIAKIKKIPFVFTYHTLWSKYAHYLLNGLLIKPYMIEAASRMFCNWCTQIVAPTKKLKEELLSYGVKKPIRIIPSGLDLTIFENIKKGFLRGKIKIKDTDRILLYAGRLGKEKSIDFLIRAFEIVSEKDKNTVLAIVGDGPEKSKLQDLAKSFGLQNKVYFLGNIDSEYMPQIYKDAEMFLFASTTETQGLVILEAMASGLPVVAVDDPAIMIENNKDGIISKKDINEYAKSILLVLENDNFRNELARNAKQDAQKFSIVKTVDALEELYLEYVITPQIFSARLISVVIPAYNEEAYLENCLAALKKQNYKGEYEIILVDNNSTDKTSQIAKKFGANVVLEKKQGYVFALKRGMSEAKGDIIAVTDADTQVPTDWLSLIAEAFGEESVVAITGLAKVQVGLRIMDVLMNLSFALFSMSTLMIGKPNLNGFNFAVRKEAFMKAGGLNTDFLMGPDVDLGIRLAKMGKIQVSKHLLVQTSARRWQKDFMSALQEYATGYVYATWFRKPPPVKQTAIR